MANIIQYIKKDRTMFWDRPGDKDIFYVGGGNTRNLLALWKAWRLDKYLNEAWLNGLVLAGISAGSIC